MIRTRKARWSILRENKPIINVIVIKSKSACNPDSKPYPLKTHPPSPHRSVLPTQAQMQIRWVNTGRSRILHVPTSHNIASPPLCPCFVGTGARWWRCLRQGLVARTAVVRLPVGEQPVDDEPTDGEEENEERPEELVDGWAVRLDDLDWTRVWLASAIRVVRRVWE
jgi:hypothetical protein